MIFSPETKPNPSQLSIDPNEQDLSLIPKLESAHVDKTQVAKIDNDFLSAIGEFELATEEVSHSFRKTVGQIGMKTIDALINRPIEGIMGAYDWATGTDIKKKTVKTEKESDKEFYNLLLGALQEQGYEETDASTQAKILLKGYKEKQKKGLEEETKVLGAPITGDINPWQFAKDILKKKMGKQRYAELMDKMAIDINVGAEHESNGLLGFSIGLTKSFFLTDEFIDWKGEGAARLEQGFPHLFGQITGMGLMIMATRKAMSKVPAYQKFFIPEKGIKEITPTGQVNLAKVFRETERLRNAPKWYHGTGILYKGLEYLKTGNKLKVQRLSDMAYKMGTMMVHATDGAIMYGSSDLINRLGSKSITGEDWTRQDTEEFLRKMELGAGMSAIGGHYAMKAWPVLGKKSAEELSQIGLGFLFSLSQIAKEKGTVTKEDLSGAMLYELLEEIPELGLTVIMPLLGGTAPLGVDREASLVSAKRNLDDSFKQLLRVNMPEVKNDLELLNKAESLTRGAFADLEAQTKGKYNRAPTMREMLNMVKDVRRQIHNQISSKPVRERYKFKKDLQTILRDNPEQLSILRQLESLHHGLAKIDREDIEVDVMLGAIEGAEAIKPTAKGGQKRVKIALSEPLSGDMDFVVGKVWDITQRAQKYEEKTGRKLFPKDKLRSEIKEKLITYRVPTKPSDGRLEASRGRHMPKINYEAMWDEHLSRNKVAETEEKTRKGKIIEIAKRSGLSSEDIKKISSPRTTEEAIDDLLSSELKMSKSEYRKWKADQLAIVEGKAEGKLTEQEFGSFISNWTRKIFGAPIKYEDFTTVHLEYLRMDMETFDRMGDTWSYIEKMGYINPNNDFNIDRINSNILHKMKGLPDHASEFGWSNELATAKTRSVEWSQDKMNADDDIRMILSPLGRYRIFQRFNIEDKIINSVMEHLGSTDDPNDFPIEDLQTEIFKETKKLVPMDILKPVIEEFRAWWISDHDSPYFKGEGRGHTWHTNGMAEEAKLGVGITLKQYAPVIHEIAEGKDPLKIAEIIENPSEFIRKSGSKGIPRKVWEEKGYKLGKEQINVYLSRMLNKKHYADIVKSIENKMVQSNAPESARVIARDFCLSLKGVPVDISIRNAFATGLNKLPMVNLTSDDIPRLVNTGLNFIYAGGLGLRPASILKNVFQGPMNNPPGMGSHYWIVGLWRTWTSQEYRNIAHENGIFRTYSLPGLYDEYASGLSKVLNKTLAGFVWVDHYFNRVPIYLGARAQLEHYVNVRGASDGLRRIASRQPQGIRPEFERAGKTLEGYAERMESLRPDDATYKKMQKRVYELDKILYEPDSKNTDKILRERELLHQELEATEARNEDYIMARNRYNLEFDKIAHLYGFLQQANSNWEYGKFGRPHYLRGIGGRMGFTFMSWGSWYYGTYLPSLLKHDKAGFAQHLAKGIMIQYFMAKYFGMNMKPWLLTGPLPTKPYGPIPQVLFQAAEVVQAWNYGNEEMRIRAMDDLKRSAKIFIPGSYAFYDWVALMREFQRDFPCFDSRTGLLQYEPNMKKALSDFFGVTDYYNQTNQAADLLRGATIEEYEKGRKIAEKWNMVPYSKEKKKRGIKGVGGVGGVKGVEGF